ncbi:MAG: Lrp/AsnC family transcriptional regulator [Cellvibrio sp.]|jgi:Lrp/AsnC family transcriptional regulator|nr:Lrp/AsnC family transcriptional regulator [Cellvibrio sp.]
MSRVEIDDIDRAILRALQQNADYSMADLGNLVGLSHTPCWRRLKRLEAEGVIQNKVTLLDANKLNLKVTIHAYITIKHHEQLALEAFESAVMAIPEIVECYSTSGDKDYVLRVVVESVEHYERLMKTQLINLPNLGSINSAFALKQVKYTTQLPI